MLSTYLQFWINFHNWVKIIVIEQGLIFWLQEQFIKFELYLKFGVPKHF